jgi:HEAT repeat protein
VCLTFFKYFPNPEFQYRLKPMTSNTFRKIILSLLKTESLEAILAEVRRMPPRQVVNALLTFLYHADGTVKWHAVSALGAAMALLAETNMEAARVVVRRLMWSLNDESGGIGWGAPEALGEIMNAHPPLAEEYAYALVAYTRRDGPYLKLPFLQRGLMWGVCRLAQTRPDLLQKWEAPAYLPSYLNSKDPDVRGLSARAIGMLRVKGARESLAALENDPAEFVLYGMNGFETTTVGKLAREALASLA